MTDHEKKILIFAAKCDFEGTCANSSMCNGFPQVEILLLLASAKEHQNMYIANA